MDPILTPIQLVLLGFSLLGVAVAEPTLWPTHLLKAALSLLAAFTFAYLIPPGPLLRNALLLHLGVIGLLILVLLVGEGPGGVRRWLDLGPLQLQPSELAKVSLVLYLASFVGRRGTDYPILGPCLVIGFTAGFILLEPDFATALFLYTLALAVLLFIGLPLRRLLSILLSSLFLALAVGGVYLERFRYIAERFRAFLGFWVGQANPQEEAYQVLQAKKALLMAGPLGHGPGGSLPHIPEAHNDMIFASIVYATGWLGGGAVLLLYGLLFFRGLQIALRLKGAESVLALGLTFYLAFQTALNIGVTLGVFPVTGIPLPLLSYGGSALLVAGMALGLLSALAQRGEGGRVWS
ncbi:MAG: FtsW/RodA/SpoVE family cell cycle protein [Thermaceae bacterium]